MKLSERLEGLKMAHYSNNGEHITQTSAKILQDLEDMLPEYNSKLSRSYVNSSEPKSHKNGYRLAIREIRENLRKYCSQEVEE